MNCHSTRKLLNYFSDTFILWFLMVVNRLKRKWTCKTLKQQKEWQSITWGIQHNHCNGGHCFRTKSSSVLCWFGAAKLDTLIGVGEKITQTLDASCTALNLTIAQQMKPEMTKSNRVSKPAEVHVQLLSQGRRWTLHEYLFFSPVEELICLSFATIFLSDFMAEHMFASFR